MKDSMSSEKEIIKPAPPEPAGCFLFGLIAVGGMMLLGVLSIFLFILNGESIMEDRIPGLREALHQGMTTFREEGKVPETHTALVDALEALVELDDIGVLSIYAIGRTFNETLEDGELSPAEVERLEATLSYLEENPAPSGGAITKFQQQWTE